MKKKAVGILLATMSVMAAVTGCGAKNEIAEAVAVESSVTVTEETGLIVEDVETIKPETVQLEAVEPIYTDRQDLFFADNFSKLDRERLDTVDENSLEKTYKDYILSDETDLYNFEGTWVGYSKPDIEVVLFGTNDKWAEVSFIEMVLYIPKDTFDSIATPKEEVEATKSSEILLAEAEEPAPKQETTPSKPKTEIPVTNEPVATQPVVEPEPVVVNTKYTPEEAIAVYRSIMEANGIQWDPSLKNGGSWGTGWFYLEKGWIDENAYSSVESFRMGDSVGNSWDCYYLEITGSDENCVYFTKWHP